MDFSESALFLRNESLRCVPNIARVFARFKVCGLVCGLFVRSEKAAQVLLYLRI